MFLWPAVFLVAAIISGLFGFNVTGLYRSEVWTTVFYVAAGLFLVSLVLALLRWSGLRGRNEDEDAPLSNRGLPTDET